MSFDRDQADKPSTGPSDLSDLRLLQLADSALPIGAMSHSFGLESLTANEILEPSNLPDFLRAYLEESGTMEAVSCREGFRQAVAGEESFSPARWIRLNQRLGAWKPAREARAASCALGRNFLNAVTGLGNFPVIQAALQATRDAGAQQSPDRPSAVVHHSAAFGLASGALGFGEDRAVLAYLHQSAASLVSACQRLLPLGQSRAAGILWDLKAAIIEAAARSAVVTLDSACSFTPVLDWGAMEHPALATRLFIS